VGETAQLMVDFAWRGRKRKLGARGGSGEKDPGDEQSGGAESAAAEGEGSVHFRFLLS